MIKVAVVGATGYTGLELLRILLTHPRVEIAAITSTSRPDTLLSEIHPSLKKITHIKTEDFDPARLSHISDIVFTALPHGSSVSSVEALFKEGLKVVDLSADFRFNDASVYNKWYGEHGAVHLLGEAVYGLPEINRDKIKGARLVGNPGCYPTSVLLPLAPLVKSGLLDSGTIVVNSVSGASGAGKTPAVASLFCEVSEGFKAYKVGEHRHTPEMEELIKEIEGDDVKITFTPHLAPMSRGILSTITAEIKSGTSSRDVLSCLEEFYSEDFFVRICKEGDYPDVSHVRGSNFCDIGAKIDDRTGRVVIISAIDNLVKGAAGQAVQNMNIMSGFAEDDGLRHVPLAL